MKHFALVVSLLLCASASAQQAPGAVFESPKEKRMAHVPAAAKLPSNEEMAALLRAQTAAIQALSAKVEVLEARIVKLEQRGR